MVLEMLGVVDYLKLLRLSVVREIIVVLLGRFVLDQIYKSKGIKVSESDKPKMRLYNSPNVNTKGVKDPRHFLEVYPTANDAPNMPEPCRKLLVSLPS